MGSSYVKLNRNAVHPPRYEAPKITTILHCGQFTIPHTTYDLPFTRPFQAKGRWWGIILHPRISLSLSLPRIGAHVLHKQGEGKLPVERVKSGFWSQMSRGQPSSDQWRQTNPWHLPKARAGLIRGERKIRTHFKGRADQHQTIL